MSIKVELGVTIGMTMPQPLTKASAERFIRSDERAQAMLSERMAELIAQSKGRTRSGLKRKLNELVRSGLAKSATSEEHSAARNRQS